MRTRHQGDLVDQWRVLRTIISDDRARMIHVRVARVLLDSYREDYRNSLAGVTYLAAATGLTRGSVATATADLVAWGYFSRRMGYGTRPTRYFPNWASVLQRQDADAIVLQPQDASIPHPQDESVLQRQEESYLPVSSYEDDLLVVGDSLPAPRGGAAHPPLARAGGAAAEASTAGPEGRFRELWAIWPRKVKRRDALAAYLKLAPDDALHAELLATAAAWRDRYVEIERPPAYQAQLAGWLENVRWEEDLPEPKNEPPAKKKRSPKATKAPKPKPPATPPAPVGVAPPPEEPAEWRRLRVTAASLAEARTNGTEVRVEFDGGAASVRCTYEHPDPRAQEFGRQKLLSLCRAADVRTIDDTDDLLGAEIIALVRGDTIERYHYPDQGPAPACVA